MSIEQYLIGEVGEHMVEDILKRVPTKIKYTHNLYLLNDNNKTTQIDFVVLASKGIYVIEVKNIQGSVIANQNDIYWAVICNGKTHKLYNPSLQNSSHIKSLRQVLGDNYPYYNLVVFNDDTNLQGDLANVKHFSDLWNIFEDEDDCPEVLADVQIEELDTKLKGLLKDAPYLCLLHNKQQTKYRR